MVVDFSILRKVNNNVIHYLDEVLFTSHNFYFYTRIMYEYQYKYR